MSVHIRIDGGTAVLSHAAPPPSEPFAAALVEARGALLTWPLPAAPFPDAAVHSPAEAADWLGEVYGAEVAAAVLAADAGPAGGGADGDTAVPLPDAAAPEADLAPAVRRRALLSWARDWWPAGRVVPGIDRDVLAAEIAVAAHAVEHLLDDDEAVEHALAEATEAPVALAAITGPLAADAAALSEALAELADDYGVELAPAAAPARRADWALAAGGSDTAHEGVEIGAGTAPVRWADVPAQTIAADADARWSLRHIAGRTALSVEADAAPARHQPNTRLRARFGPDELGIDLALATAGAVFRGATEVPASIALLPLEQRTLWVRDARLAAHPGPAEDAAAREAVLAHATARLTDPTASLAERLAGARP